MSPLGSPATEKTETLRDADQAGKTEADESKTAERAKRERAENELAEVRRALRKLTKGLNITQG
ncbi:MAG: hypothetical protein PHF56_19735 [Desulfuromonadaceae bacterium]|nr:hypothetical protein [Desulfuromonadaceae bacterium]